MKDLGQFGSERQRGEEDEEVYGVLGWGGGLSEGEGEGRRGGGEERGAGDDNPYYYYPPCPPPSSPPSPPPQQRDEQEQGVQPSVSQVRTQPKVSVTLPSVSPPLQQGARERTRGGEGGGGGDKGVTGAVKREQGLEPKRTSQKEGETTKLKGGVRRQAVQGGGERDVSRAEEKKGEEKEDAKQSKPATGGRRTGDSRGISTTPGVRTAGGGLVTALPIATATTVGIGGGGVIGGLYCYASPPSISSPSPHVAINPPPTVVFNPSSSLIHLQHPSPLLVSQKSPPVVMPSAASMMYHPAQPHVSPSGASSTSTTTNVASIVPSLPSPPPPPPLYDANTILYQAPVLMTTGGGG